MEPFDTMHFTQEAYLRHANYYLTQLKTLGTLYQQGGASSVQAIEQLDREWPQIKLGQRWSASKDNPAAASICSDYSQVAHSLLNLRQVAEERIQWLQFSLRAANSLGDQEAAALHLANLVVPEKV